jgi:hypothetical protein
MECMSLMNVLCPALPGTAITRLSLVNWELGAHRNCADPGVKSAGEWIQQKIESESTATLISVFESTEKKIRLPSSTPFARERIQYWLTSLHASLDCYVWLFAEGYAHPQIILDGTLPPSLNFLHFLELLSFSWHIP